jgi:hypothetical protein
MPTTQGELELDAVADEATVAGSCAAHPTSLNAVAIPALVKTQPLYKIASCTEPNSQIQQL